MERKFRFFRAFRVRKKEETDFSDLSERIYWFNFLTICFRHLKKQDKTNKTYKNKMFYPVFFCFNWFF